MLDEMTLYTFEKKKLLCDRTEQSNIFYVHLIN